MYSMLTSAWTLMLLIPGAEPPADNPWPARLRELLSAAQAAPADVLDAAWRADDWQVGLEHARRLLAVEPIPPKLQGLVVRALWRAGQLADAEALAAKLPRDTRDPVALRGLIELESARGGPAAVRPLVERLAARSALTSEDLLALFNQRFLAGEMEGLADLARRVEKLIDPADGYPSLYMSEAVEGVAEYLAAIGPQPLNQLAEPGAAPMPPLPLFKLPSCDVLINGRGPYRMVVDTGGSLIIALDQTVADELNLKSVAPGSIRGASGKTETGQIVLDDVQLGSIRLRRVIGRTFDVRSAVLNAADGVLGTGVFLGGRMTLDFAGGQLAVARSSEKPGPGRAVDARVISDAKLIVPLTLGAQTGVGLLDTGADVIALAPSRLKQLFPDRDLPTLNTSIAIGVGSGEQTSITTSAGVTVAFGDHEFKNCGGLGLDVLDKTLSPALGLQIDILLGMPAFREMKTCTVDFPTCRMWIDWQTAP